MSACASRLSRWVNTKNTKTTTLPARAVAWLRPGACLLWAGVFLWIFVKNFSPPKRTPTREA